jgi:predicted ArsR family transcriptional regulator
MSDTIRIQILQYLEEKHSATARELCNELRVTHADVRYHVNNLLYEKRIIGVSGKAASAGRGRPSRQYTLAPANQAANMSLLLGLLISLYSSEFPQDYIKRVAYSLADAMDPTIGKVEVGSISIRLNQMITCLNQHNYSAKWIASSTGPVIYLSSCPFVEIKYKRPEICEIDRLLLNKLSGCEMHLSRTNNTLDGHQGPCKFTFMMQ